MSLRVALSPPRAVNAGRYQVGPTGDDPVPELPSGLELAAPGARLKLCHNIALYWSGGGFFGAYVACLRPSLDRILKPTGLDH